MSGRDFHDFTKLIVWQRAETLAVDIYRATDAPLWRASMGLRGQLRNAIGSIAANIAEGARAGTRPEFARFLGIAIASASESQSHLSFARRLTLIDADAYDALASETVEVCRMLIGLQRWVRAEHDLDKKKRGATTKRRRTS